MRTALVEMTSGYRRCQTSSAPTTSTMTTPYGQPSSRTRASSTSPSAVNPAATPIVAGESRDRVATL